MNISDFDIPAWLETEIFGSSMLQWAGGACLFLLVLGLLALLRRVLRHRLDTLAARRQLVPLRVAAHAVAQTRSWFLLLISLYAGSRVLSLPASVHETVGLLALVVVLLQTGLWTSAAIARFLGIRRERELRENPGAVAAMDILTFVGRVAVWSLILLVLLDNLGVDITTLVAGLGVGGIAVALAAQNVLGDLFASLSIVLDKPFVVGDFLTVGDFLGTVEKVGIKTTRIRSLSGEEVILANNDLLASRIRNYGRMQERRVVFSIGITYETPPDRLAAVADMLRESVEAQPDVRFDRAHFAKYGDFALIFEVVYYVRSADYNRYMDLQQAINIGIYERFAAAGIEFAYPTQKLYLSRNA